MFQKAKIKIAAYFAAKERDQLIAKLDTPEEREVIVAEAVKKGMPEWMASTASMILSALQLTLVGMDMSTLFDNPVLFGKMLLLGVLNRMLLQATPPSTKSLIAKSTSSGDSTPKE